MIKLEQNIIFVKQYVQSINKDLDSVVDDSDNGSTKREILENLLVEYDSALNTIIPNSFMDAAQNNFKEKDKNSLKELIEIKEMIPKITDMLLQT